MKAPDGFPFPCAVVHAITEKMLFAIQRDVVNPGPPRTHDFAEAAVFSTMVMLICSADEEAVSLVLTQAADALTEMALYPDYLRYLRQNPGVDAERRP